MGKWLRKTDSACLLLIGILCATSFTGCTHRFTDFEAFVREPKALVSSEAYFLAPPDTITISSKRVREIARHTEQIRPDGRINLPLLGSVFVAGKTCEQLSEELSDKAREFYEDADVTVTVTHYASKKIFVFGEVRAPGPYSYSGTNTILEMLSRAHPTRLADAKNIHVMRPSDDGALRKSMTIDLDRMVKEGDTTLNAMLQEGDVIYVPPTPLAQVGLVFQQMLLPLQPAAATVKGPADIYNNSQPNVYGSNGTR